VNLDLGEREQRADEKERVEREKKREEKSISSSMKTLNKKTPKGKSVT